MKRLTEIFRNPWLWLAGVVVLAFAAAGLADLAGFVAAGVLMKGATFLAAVVFAMVGLQIVRFVRGLTSAVDEAARAIDEDALAAAIVRAGIYIGLFLLAGAAFGQSTAPAAWPQTDPAAIVTPAPVTLAVDPAPAGPAIPARFARCAQYLEAAENAVGIYWGGFQYPRAYLAQLYQESLCDPAAVSPVGAAGIAQFMPATWIEAQARLGLAVELTPHDDIAIEAGAWYMARQFATWRAPRPALERWRLALASYNAGAGNIIAAQSECNGARDWRQIETCLSDVTGRHAAETRGYVPRIESHWRQLAGPDPRAAPAEIREGRS